MARGSDLDGWGNTRSPLTAYQQVRRAANRHLRIDYHFMGVV